MSRNSRLVILVIVVAMLFALPSTALANKRIFRANLTRGAELHQVIGSNAHGSIILGTWPDAIRFQAVVYNLSGPVSGVHIHAPATTSQTAPVIVTLCGQPAPAALATCTVDGNGTLLIQGQITSSLMAKWGVTAPQFLQWLQDGLAYVNVHTALNPMGEVRGQLTEQ
jgi:hypothetical protein